MLQIFGNLLRAVTNRFDVLLEAKCMPWPLRIQDAKAGRLLSSNPLSNPMIMSFSVPVSRRMPESSSTYDHFVSNTYSMKMQDSTGV